MLLSLFSKSVSETVLKVFSNGYRSSISLDKLYPRSDLDILSKPQIEVNESSSFFPTLFTLTRTKTIISSQIRIRSSTATYRSVIIKLVLSIWFDLATKCGIKFTDKLKITNKTCSKPGGQNVNKSNYEIE